MKFDSTVDKMDSKTNTLGGHEELANTVPMETGTQKIHEKIVNAI